jgi:MoxR-like ATPase
MSIDKVRELGAALRERIGLISEGHVLFDGPPGTGKTLLARCFSACLKLDFKRVQFTPDLMPGDLVGTNLFNFQSNTFTLTKGPLFTEFLLADEINRTPPKTQAALLEAMQERTITIDGTSHPLSQGFMVVATQNPIEQEGTYPLPEAQLDRFLFKILIGYPNRDEELAMVRTHGHQTAMPKLDKLGVAPVCDLRFITWVRQTVAALRLADETVAYVVDLIRATRSHPALQYGASPRAANMLAAASRAAAVLEGREFVIPDDVKTLFKPLLRHRVVLAPSAEVDGLGTDQVLEQILQQVPAPR